MIFEQIFKKAQILSYYEIAAILSLPFIFLLIVYTLGAYRRKKDRKDIARLLSASREAFHRDMIASVNQFTKSLYEINEKNSILINEHNTRTLLVMKSQTNDINQVSSKLIDIDQVLSAQKKCYERVIMLQKVIVKKNKKREEHS